MSSDRQSYVSMPAVVPEGFCLPSEYAKSVQLAMDPPRGSQAPHSRTHATVDTPTGSTVDMTVDTPSGPTAENPFRDLNNWHTSPRPSTENDGLKAVGLNNVRDRRSGLSLQLPFSTDFLKLAQSPDASTHCGHGCGRTVDISAKLVHQMPHCWHGQR